MRVSSLGHRTDLMVRALGGAEVTDHGDFLSVRTPDNPNFWWGNFILVAEPPGPGDAARWQAVFAEQFPDAGHLAIGVDGTTGETGDPAEIAALGVEVEVLSVLTSQAITPPARPNRQADYRPLDRAADWAQLLELRLACFPDESIGVDRQFLERRLASNRQVCERQPGRGRWFGAFLDGDLCCAMGLYTDGAGLARFADVETHPEQRGHGLASTLTAEVAGFGLRDWAAERLVIVAEPDSQAGRIYRALGFDGHERQVQLQRAPVR